jgi:hypothetical protein
MGTYNEWIDGFVRESTWGSTAIGASNVTAYKLGLLGDESPTTWETIATSLYSPTAVNAQEVAAERLYKTRFNTTCAMVVGMQNGVLLELVMGKSSTVDDSPSAGYNTHTITPPTAVAGVLPTLDSVTWQHEKKGSATDWATQILGAKVARLRLYADIDTKGYLLSDVSWLAKKPTDPGFVLDNAPALPATANTNVFELNNTTISYNSVDISEYVRGLEFEITPGIRQVFGHTWTGGVYDGHWPNQFIEAFRKGYTLKLTVTPWADDVYDELITVTNTAAALKDGYIKFTRHSTQDYIQLNFTDLMVLEHPLTTPAQGEEELITTVMEPRALSITVVDQLEGSDYGE